VRHDLGEASLTVVCLIDLFKGSSSVLQSHQISWGTNRSYRKRCKIDYRKIK
jgi:hypothetical protein